MSRSSRDELNKAKVDQNFCYVHVLKKFAFLDNKIIAIIGCTLKYEKQDALYILIGRLKVHFDRIRVKHSFD